jgi:hypothetical protein
MPVWRECPNANIFSLICSKVTPSFLFDAIDVAIALSIPAVYHLISEHNGAKGISLESGIIQVIVNALIPGLEMNS